ncbi:MAG: thioredoxin domain-containing protein [Methanoregula sp.]
MIAIIAGIAIILVAILMAGIMQGGQGTIVPPTDCGEKTIAYINNNLVTPGTTIELVSVSDSHGLYEMKSRYQSQDITLYATKDCTLLFTSTMNMSVSDGVQQTAQATQAPVKSARPAVDLYIMSFCPYGTQAETVMSPVVQLLGSKTDIRIRYVTTITGTTVDSVDSLHGMSEAKEDLQQICINKYYPEKLWAYLETFNTACYPGWQNTAALESCRKNTTAALSIDSVKIDTCAQGAEGLALLKTDAETSGQNSIYSSPTLMINGVKYSGARTPEAFKQAICNSFETVPAECSTVLSSTTASGTTGGCG